MNAITQYLALFSIRQKLWGGFAVLLAILVLVSSNTLINLSSTQADIELVTHDIQPTLIASNDLRVVLKDTTSALGFFLLTKQKIHKDTYHQGLLQLDKSLDQLKNAPLVQRDPEILELISAVNTDVDLFKTYEPRMLKLADSLTDNFYALGFAGSKMNPINQDVAQIAANMIQSEQEESASAKRRPLLINISELRYTWANVINNVRIYLFYGNDDALSNVRLFYSGVKSLIEKIANEKDILTFEQEEAIEPMREKILQWGKYLEELVAIQQGDQTRMDAFLIKTEIGPILARVDERLGKLDQKLREQTEQTGKEMIAQADATTAIVQMLLVVGLLVGGLFGWVITRVIAQPINSAAIAMEDIAEGEGDLTRRLAVVGRDEIAQLATGFNHFVDKIQVVIRQVTDAVSQVSNTAGELSVATQNANRVTEQQKQETTQIATAVTQMSANSQEVARHAEIAAQAANQVDKETQAGQRIVAEALEGIRSLVDDTQSAADAVGQLGIDIEDIGSVIAMIGGITDQTNLLALNAAIEAARAGEQGRGFAVVADEVRTLAERTKQSTNEIRGRIETLQSHAHDAVNQMNRNRDVAQNTSGLASRAGESLKLITQSVSSINDMTHQIASSAEEQSVVAGEVNLNVCNISRLADDAEAATNSVAASCDSLEQLSVTLNKLVGKFKA